MKRPGLTRERIVATAMQMADRDGLDAVTLRRIAARMKVHVTSLYNHVPTKDAVLDGVVERLIAEAELPTTSATWQDWVREFASSMRAVAQRHPGAFAAFHHRPVQGPEASAAVEAALAVFGAAGFDDAESYSAVKSVTFAVLGLALEDQAGVESSGSPTDLSVLSVERFPHLHAIGEVAEHADVASYLIDALIAGIAANHRRAVKNRTNL